MLADHSVKCLACGFATKHDWASLDCPRCHKPAGYVDGPAPKKPPPTGSAKIVPLASAPARAVRRVSVGSEIDRALGGGWPVPSSYTISGPPGAGKTTGALRWASRIAAATNRPAVLVSAEMAQGLARAYVERLGLELERFLVLESNSVELLRAEAPKLSPRPSCIIVDSASRMVTDAHGVNTPQAIAATIGACIELARSCEAVALVIFHATKDGRIKSPSDSDHEVDGTIWVYEDGRAEVEKHRHGPAPSSFSARVA